MLAALYELQEAVEAKLYNGVVPETAHYVALVEQHSNLDEMIVAAGGKSATITSY